MANPGFAALRGIQAVSQADLDQDLLRDSPADAAPQQELATLVGFNSDRFTNGLCCTCSAP